MICFKISYRLAGMIILNLFIFSQLFAQNTSPPRSLDHKHYVMVLVLEIPLFSRPDTSSEILQYRRKGELLYVKENISEGAPWRPNYDLVQYFEQGSYDNYLHDLQKTELVKKQSGKLNRDNLEIEREGFFTTMDNIGRVAYIPKVFVKPLYHDGRELIETVNRFDHDPMDYRKPEPIGPSYPFVEARDLIFHVHYGISPGDRMRFDYGPEPLAEDYQTQGSLQMGMAKKLAFDKDRRWSFGLLGEVSWQRSYFQLGDRHQAEERMQRIGLSPILGYEAFRGHYLSAELIGGIFVFPWLKLKSSELKGNGLHTDRIHEGYQVAPHLSAHVYLPPFLETLRLGVGLTISYPWTSPLKKTFSSDLAETDTSYRVKPAPDFAMALAFRGQY